MQRLSREGRENHARLLELTGRITNMDVTDSGSPIQILDDGYRQRKIKTLIRIGIIKATEELLRFRAIIKKP
jgi:3-methyladenine DNA glycosylase Mpg